MPSPLLEAVAWTWLALSLASALVILADVAVRRHRQSMPVMEWVWPITSLYLGPIALWAYLRYGRQYSPAYLAEHPAAPMAPAADVAAMDMSGSDMTGMDMSDSDAGGSDVAGMDMSDSDAGDRDMAGMDMSERPPVPHWVRVGISTSHCGAGCTLGDIAAEWLIFGLGLTLFGAAIYASFVLDYLFAFTLGVVFQYFAITEMGTRDWGELVRRTAKADAYSLTAFEVGLFAWMALTYFVLFTSPHLTPTSPVFWFMMQVGMIIGFCTSYPANAWLIRRGVKEAM